MKTSNTNIKCWSMLTPFCTNPKNYRAFANLSETTVSFEARAVQRRANHENLSHKMLKHYLKLQTAALIQQKTIILNSVWPTTNLDTQPPGSKNKSANDAIGKIWQGGDRRTVHTVNKASSTEGAPQPRGSPEEWRPETEMIRNQDSRALMP